MNLTYAERAQDCRNPIAASLFHLMEKKQSNLAVAVDVTRQEELLHLADLLGPSICILKTHIDILEDFDSKVVNRLQDLAKKHHFLLFEDRKFADIGKTVQNQYQKGIYRIAEWADLTNAHILPGPGIIQGLKEVGLPLGRGLILLAEMSSSGSLMDASYTKACVSLALEHRDFVIGFITQHKLIEAPEFIHFMPGVHSEQKGDPLGQRYQTPESAILERGADVVIVGKGITHATNSLESLKYYHKKCWNVYKKRISA